MQPARVQVRLLLIAVTSFASTIWSFSGLESSTLKEEAVLQDCTSLSELTWEPTGGERLLSVEDREFRLYGGPEFAPVSQAKFTGGRPATASAWSRAEDSSIGTLTLTAAIALESSLTLWDLRTMKQTQVRERAHLDTLRSVDFHSKNQHFLVTGAEDGRVKIWDQRKFDKPYLSFNAHSHWVFAVKFSRNIGFMLASAGADAKVCKLALRLGEPVPLGLNSGWQD